MLPLSDASSKFALARTRTNPDDTLSHHDHKLRSFGFGVAPPSLGPVSPAHRKFHDDKQIQVLKSMLPRDFGRAQETVRAESRSSSANSILKRLNLFPSLEEPMLAAGDLSC